MQKLVHLYTDKGYYTIPAEWVAFTKESGEKLEVFLHRELIPDSCANIIISPVVITNPNAIEEFNNSWLR